MRTHEPRLATFSTAANLLSWLRYVWETTSIQTKLLFPLLLLMLLSLAGSALGFLISLNSTRDQMLDRQLDEDMRQIESALLSSEEEALDSARMLAQGLDSSLMAEHTEQENHAQQMSSLVVVARQRFWLDQVLVLNTDREVRVNKAHSHLESIHIRAPDLLPTCSQPETHLEAYKSERFDDTQHPEYLLIACVPVIAGADIDTPNISLGNVYTVLELDEVLKRIRRDLELAATPRLDYVPRTTSAAQNREQPDTTATSYSEGSFRVRTVPIAIGNNTIDLTLLLDTRSIREIISSGFQSMLVSSALAILFSVAVAWLIIRQLLIRPLIRLTTIAEQVARGDLTARASIKTQDEIGRLATTFNGTTAQLQELVTGLEMRVAQRTTELTEANKQLLLEIGERRRAEDHILRQKQELERLATTDELTDLYNRRHFFALGEHEIRNAHANGNKLAVIMLDIDHFKKINDTYGHACGDVVIKRVAQRCRSSLRDTDILGRYGGEEFAILLPRTSVDVAYTVAERLREEVAAMPIYTDCKAINVTISVGIATASREDMPCKLDALLERADAALYTAKRTGRNRVVMAEQAPVQP